MTINYSEIKSIDELCEFSKLIEKGVFIKPDITKIAREYGCDRKTVRKRLKGFLPSKTRKRKKYLDEFKIL